MRGRIRLAMYLPAGKDRMVAGTYTYVNFLDAAPFTFTYGTIDDRWDPRIRIYEMVSGKVTVTVSGDQYTINVNGVFEGGESIKGNYTGKVTWSDGKY